MTVEEIVVHVTEMCNRAAVQPDHLRAQHQVQAYREVLDLLDPEGAIRDELEESDPIRYRKMPHHTISDAEGSSIPDHLKDIVCKGSLKPGYVHVNLDGTWHCNSCGWVTPEPVS